MTAAGGGARLIICLVGVVLAGCLVGCGSTALDGPEDDAASSTRDGQSEADAGNGGGGGDTSGRSGSGSSGSAGNRGSSDTSQGAGGSTDVATGGTGDTTGTSGGSGGGSAGTGGGGDTGNGSDASGDAEDQWHWDLPFGDETVSINEDVLYRIIDRGACDEAQTYLNDLWSTLRNPRAVLLYQAAIDLCRGDLESARSSFGRAESDYGWAGVLSPYLDCNVYQAAQSVFQQKPPSAFVCQDGQAPPWPTDDSNARVDPRLPP